MRRLLNHVRNLIPSSLLELGSRFYNRLPASVRYGKEYLETAGFLEESQYWSKERLEGYQLTTVKALIHHAFSNVPFYRSYYTAHGVTPDDIHTLDDIRKLPTISKDTLRTHREQLKATNYPASQFQYHTTGGSTGIPVGLYWETSRTVPREWAFMGRQWKWMGFDFEHDKYVTLRGIPVRRGKLYEKPSPNIIRFSSYDLTPENMNRILDVIQSFKPKAIHAYPSSAYILAQHILSIGGASIPSLKVLLCGSENLYEWQLEALESAFQCPVYSWYGQSEYIALAGWCEQCRLYHFYNEYGITEILNADGTPVQPGEIGEIVATGFNNFAFPLIRYRMEDLARLSTTLHCNCGRNYMLVDRIEGRLQEMIVTKQGNLISMTAINMHNDIFDNVHQFQFYQDQQGIVVLSIVRKDTYSSNDERIITEALVQKFRDQVELSLTYVDHIPLTSSGKARFLIQKLSLGNSWKDASEQ